MKMSTLMNMATVQLQTKNAAKHKEYLSLLIIHGKKIVRWTFTMCKLGAKIVSQHDGWKFYFQINYFVPKNWFKGNI